jgi:hypothetical protein
VTDHDDVASTDRKPGRVGVAAARPRRVTPARSSPSGSWRRGRPGVSLDACWPIPARVLEMGLEVEISEHRGYDKHASEGGDGDNPGKGTRAVLAGRGCDGDLAVRQGTDRREDRGASGR